MKKIKLIEVIADSSLSGAPKHVLTLISKIDKSQFSVVLVCPRGWLVGQIKSQKSKVKSIPLKNFFDLKSILKLRKIIKQENPDIIHLHGIRAGWLGVLAARRLKNRIIYTEHLYTKSYHLESRLREWLQLQGLSCILKNVRIIIAPSRAVKNFLTSKFKIKSRKIKVVYNGLEDADLSFRRLRQYIGRGEISPMRVGYIGSLDYQKGVDILVKAFAKIKKEFPQSQLEIIGDGPLKKSLNANFVGAKSNIWEYLLNWKMLVVPSRSESFGQTAVEAAIMSKPVVAAKVGGLPEVVIHGQTGILIQKNNPKTLAYAIICLLKNPQAGEEMGRRARLRYERLFTAKKMVNQIENIYRVNGPRV